MNEGNQDYLLIDFPHDGKVYRTERFLPFAVAKHLVINSDGLKALVYTRQLAYILTTKDLKAKNIKTQKPETVNGLKYLKTYLEGFREGISEFKKFYDISPNILYGDQFERYEETLRHLYFYEKQGHLNRNGWSYIKNIYPLHISPKIIKEYGFFSGIVSQVDAMIKKHSRLFRNFYLEENQDPEKAEGKRILTYLSDDEIRVFFRTFLAQTNGSSCPFMSKDEIERLIPYCLIIPENGLENRFELNLNGEGKRVAFYYCMYLLFRKTKSPQKQKKEFTAWLKAIFKNFDECKNLSKLLKNGVPPTMRFTIDESSLNIS